MAERDDSAAALTAALIAEETSRAENDPAPIVEQLAGIGGSAMSLRDAAKAGGTGMLGVMFGLGVVDEWPRVAGLVLAPDIQETFGISDTAVLGMIGLVGVMLVLTTLPAASLGDRFKRTRLVAWSSIALGAVTAITGSTPNAFLMGLCLALGGVGVGTRLPNGSSMIADNYPIRARARVFALEGAGRPLGQLTGPLVVGGLAAIIGGTEAWRWVFVAIALPITLLGIAALALKEPERGRYEREELLGAGEALAPIDEGPIPLSAAFARLRKGQSFYFLAVGIGVLGFALASVPGLISLLLDEGYGYGAYTRGWMLAISWALSIVSIPIAGNRAEHLMRSDPPKVLKLMSGLLLAYGLAVVVALRFESIALLIGFYTVANACQSAAFVLTAPIVSSVVPPRLRSQAFALVGLYVFLMGGFFGNLLAGAMSDAWGQRTALTVVVPPAALVGAAFVMRASRSVRGDMALVAADLREENEEMHRAARSDDNPAVQVRSLNCSYGRVQVLFGCDLDVAAGETVALVGTNGSGKSTLLKTISGLMLPDRGVVRHHGRTITYADAEYRFAKGIVLVRGGDGVFPGLNVRENLIVSMTMLKLSPAEEQERIDRVIEIFPQLTDRMDQRAGSLSGGQRQMLALARALVHEPDVLVIDELSLGLAPVVVQSLIEVIEQLRARNQTMIIVEQSLNIALSIADRVVLLEKGRTRMMGTPDELRAQGEIFDAMFLGGAAHVGGAS